MDIAVDTLEITRNVGIVELLIIGLMVLLSIVVRLPMPASVGSGVINTLDNIKVRVNTLWIIVLVLAIAFNTTRTIAFIAMAFISYLAFKEYVSLVPTRRVERKVLLWAYLSIPIQFAFLYINWLNMFYLFIPLYMFLIISTRMVIANEVNKNPSNGFLKSCSTIHWGLISTVYATGYLAATLNISTDSNPLGGGVGLAIFILLATIWNDFWQMLSGKMFGHVLITPITSPHKTLAGLIGGIVMTSLLSVFLLPFVSNISWMFSLLVGVVIAIAGFFGDVTMSALKRDLGVKDSGSMLPGHGGILDRLDSLIFTAPIFYHMYSYFYL